MSWLQDKAVGINKMLNSNGAKQTEMLIERQEKIIDQLDKKRKVRNLKFTYSTILLPGIFRNLTTGS